MDAEADLAAVTRVLANRARLQMLELLMDGQAHPAGDLAREAGVAVSTASGHLAELAEAGLVEAEPAGRQRRYRLSRPEVAGAIEALAVIAPRRRVSSLAAASAAERLRQGRTCYDHLAGRLGVRITDALVARRALRRSDNGGFDVTGQGERLLGRIGVDVGAALERRRAFALACLDWSERRSHLAGALGAELCDRLFELGWVERRGSGRAVGLTEAGAEGLRGVLGPAWHDPSMPTDPGFEFDRGALERFCRRHGVRRLSLFGSALSGGLEPESDVDLLVEFEQGKIPGLIGLAGMELELAPIFGGREVELRTYEDLSRYFRDEVRSGAEALYVAA